MIMGRVTLVTRVTVDTIPHVVSTKPMIKNIKITAGISVIPGIAFVLFSLLSCTRTFTRIELDEDREERARYAETGDISAEVEQLARPLIEKNLTPGLAVGVLLPDGRKKSFGFGTTGGPEGHRPGGDTLFAIGSTSKSFVGALCAILVQERKLSWDDSLGELLCESYDLSPDAARITVWELATHSSGLPRQPFTLKTAFYFVQYSFTGENFYRHLDRDYVLDYLGRFKKPSVLNPTYSNIGYGILGYALEQQFEANLNELLQEKLLQPLNLDRTGYKAPGLEGYKKRALPHSGDHPKFVPRNRRVPEWEFTDMLMGAAGLYSSVSDLLVYAEAHMRCDGDVLLSSALRKTMEERLKLSEDRSRAIAWAVDEVDGSRIVFQTGYGGGYSAYIGMDPAQSTAVVVLQNSLNWTESIGHRLLLRMACRYGRK